MKSTARITCFHGIPHWLEIHVLLVIATGLLCGQRVSACDACNVAFSRQLQGSRAGTLISSDLMKAAENQAGLPLSGLGLEPSLTRPAAAGTSAPLLLAASSQAAPDVPGKDAVAGVDGAPVSATPWMAMQKEWKDDPFFEIIERDYNLPIPPTSYVPQTTKPDKTFTIELHEGTTYVGNGVIYDGFLTNGAIPGPTLIMDEGDIVEFNVVNKGTIPHGASLHPAYTQTSKYLGKINPGATGRVVFRATVPGVYLYHCAPGGHAIPMHVLFGQYGMMLVRPKAKVYELEKQLGRKPDLELCLIQHELYASGKDAIDGKPLYTTFNGKLFRYVEEPLKVRPGDYVRINFLNVGPNILSTFHIVGILWDYVYWQGNPAAMMPGGQSVTAGPTDSWVIEFRVPPDEGAYTMLTHAVGSASRGAIGLLVADAKATPPGLVLADGPKFTEKEMAEITSKAVRTISPFKPVKTDLLSPARYPAGTREVDVTIIGNSFHPKVIEIAPGTTVRWTNEDVFTYLAGEYAGIHNVAGLTGPDEFNGPLLAHGESFTHTFTNEGENDYMCTPHPYMRGRVVVKGLALGDLAKLAPAGKAGGLGEVWLLPIVLAAFVLAGAAFAANKKK